MAPAVAFERLVVDSCGRYIIVSLWSLAFSIGEMSRPSGTWSSTESLDVGWEVITKDPVGTASRSGLIGWSGLTVEDAIRIGEAGGLGGSS